jgi:hypothetical protein
MEYPRVNPMMPLCTSYHPLFVFNQFGDLERCALRPGNAHGADGWRRLAKIGARIVRPGRSRTWSRSGAPIASDGLGGGAIVANVAIRPDRRLTCRQHG